MAPQGAPNPQMDEASPKPSAQGAVQQLPREDRVSVAADPRREGARDAAASVAAALLDMPRYRPLSPWRRVAITLLALGTAWGVVLLLVSEPGGVKRGHREAKALAAAASSAASAASAASATSAEAAPPRAVMVMPVVVIPAASAPR